MDEKELRTEMARLHTLISDAAQQAKEQGVDSRLLDKLASAQLRIELVLRKLGPAAGR